MSVLRATLLLIALQRLAELAWASRNAARLHRLGAIEIDATGYPPFIVLHLGWLASLALCVPSAAMPRWPLLGLFALLQLGRLWVIVSLGHYWTTRILTLPGRPLVQTAGSGIQTTRWSPRRSRCCQSPSARQRWPRSGRCRT